MNARQAATAIFYILRTGCQWKALPHALGAPSTVYDRFREWGQAGVFESFWQQGRCDYDEAAGIQWKWQAVDGCMTKAPLGGEKNRPQSDGSRQGRSQAQPADRGARRAGWLGGGRRQPA